MGKALRVVLGVHAHWAGSQWSSSGSVLEQALDLALSAQQAHGAACALDVDARGLEELAARSPLVLDRLRAGLAQGKLELCGSSFAQPACALHGGESNLRQRVLGARIVRRLLGVSPRVLWEGAPGAWPQLPQVQRSLGIECFCLFTTMEEYLVETPLESIEALRLRGLDGSVLNCLAATRLARGLQTGDDFEALLGAALEQVGPLALLVWLPLDEPLATQLSARLDALRNDARLDFQARTLSSLARELCAVSDRPERGLANTDFPTGGAPAKNGDLLVRGISWCEEQLLAAESLAALLGRLADVEPQFAAWPAWEFEESWRDLFVAQHHAIPAREQRLAAVAESSIERSLALAQEVHERTLAHLARSVQGLEGGHLVLNPLGWTRDVLHDSGVARAVPAFGYRVVDPYDLDAAPLGRVRVRENSDRLTLVRGRMRVEVDRRRGVIEQISTREFPEGLLDPESIA